MRIKAFSLIELLITLSIVSSLTLLTHVALTPIEFNGKQTLYYDALSAQFEALYTQSMTNVSSDTNCVYQPIYYYENGVVNKAQSISCENGSLIVHLGSGNISEGESIFDE